MRKLTQNTFTEGMVRDFHPLTIPNNQLTTVLNGTLITMNGNEMMLLNDMGNGRVESAFLPSGYVPVGIKEYGGVIYVASYNPLTNKSQLGSFPSPERNIDLTESPTSPAALEVSVDNPISKIDLFGGKVIRSGDKFSLYFNGSNNFINNLSNYLFYKDGKPVSYSDSRGGYDEKNKVYRNDIVTLSVEVLDSNNNLRDITHLLKRFNDSDLIPESNFDGVPSLDRFNSGYFISGKAPSTTETVDDTEVTKERNKLAVNTYNNKLFGKLFLVAKLNLIDHVDFSIRAEYDKKTTGTGEELTTTENVVLKGFVTVYYNFPTTYLSAPIIKEGTTEKELAIPTGAKETYDPATNLYAQSYEGVIFTLTEDTKGLKTFTYTPKMKGIGDLETLKQSITINLDDIGSGKITVTDWRYFYTNNYMQLTWGLEAYPLIGQDIKEVDIIFTELGGEEAARLEITNKASYNGVFTTTIPFDGVFEPNKIYIAKLELDGKLIDYRTLITTDLYNDMYRVNNINYTLDYCANKKEVLDDKVKNLILSKHKITPQLNVEVVNSDLPVPEISELKSYTVTKPTGDATESIYSPIEGSFPIIKLDSPSSGDFYAAILLTENKIKETYRTNASISNSYPTITIENAKSKVAYKLDSVNISNNNINTFGEDDTYVMEAIKKLLSYSITSIPTDGKIEEGQTITFNYNIKLPSALLVNVPTSTTTVNILNVYTKFKEKLLEYLSYSYILLAAYTRDHDGNGDAGDGVGCIVYLVSGDAYTSLKDNNSYLCVLRAPFSSISRQTIGNSLWLCYDNIGESSNPKNPVIWGLEYADPTSGLVIKDRLNQALNIIGHPIVAIRSTLTNDLRIALLREINSDVRLGTIMWVGDINESDNHDAFTIYMWKGTDGKYHPLSKYLRMQDGDTDPAVSDKFIEGLIYSTIGDLYVKNYGEVGQRDAYLVNKDTVNYNYDYTSNFSVDLSLELKPKTDSGKILLKYNDVDLCDQSKIETKLDNKAKYLAPLLVFTLSQDPITSKVNKKLKSFGLNNLYSDIEEASTSGLPGLIKTDSAIYISDKDLNSLSDNVYLLIEQTLPDNTTKRFLVSMEKPLNDPYYTFLHDMYDFYNKNLTYQSGELRIKTPTLPRRVGTHAIGATSIEGDYEFNLLFDPVEYVPVPTGVFHEENPVMAEAVGNL